VRKPPSLELVASDGELVAERSRRELVAQAGELVAAAVVAAMRPNLLGVTTDAELELAWLNSRRSPATRRNYAIDLAWWRARGLPGLVRFETVAEPFTLRDLRTIHVEGALEGAPGAPASIARRVSTLRSLLAYGFRGGYLPWNIADALPTVAASGNALARRLLTLEQVFALLAASRASPRNGERDALAVRLLYVSACRGAELVGLQWRDVHPRPEGAASLTLDGKGSKTREVWVTPATAAELEGFRVAQGDELGAALPILRSRTGQPLTTRDVERIVRRDARAAGLPAGTSPHWLRHSHATHAIDAGAPIHSVSATLGHASIGTTTRYLHAAPSSGSARFLRL
jgi:integrase/recombinase XerD